MQYLNKQILPHHMPPIEAMRRGKRVVMTRESCLEEVTRGKAVYVEKPYDAEEWAEKIDAALALPEERVDFEEYGLRHVVGEYLRVFEKCAGFGTVGTAGA